MLIEISVIRIFLCINNYNMEEFMEELEKLRPGIIDDIGQIIIVEKESTIPHFTIVKDDGTKVNIMIQENRYMDGEKNSLTEEECKKLNEWAHSIEKKEWWNRGVPNWYYIILCWNSLYNDYEIIYNQECLDNIPDYTTIHH